ncbi:hypothetical protein [Luteolibacter sp. AS25]|uniref:hypothetical protein n=1 Tax=Luteolibacter sp. AS25 TaxID=3135776 RepID=UPI00398A720A
MSFCIVGLAFGKTAGLEKETQKGVGTITTTKAHGKTMYAFTPKEPNAEKLRAVKMNYEKMGYKEGFPKKIEAFLKDALDTKSEVELELEFYDKGEGKALSVASKLISYKKVE